MISMINLLSIPTALYRSSSYPVSPIWAGFKPLHLSEWPYSDEFTKHDLCLDGYELYGCFKTVEYHDGTVGVSVDHVVSSTSPILTEIIPSPSSNREYPQSQHCDTLVLPILCTTLIAKLLITLL